MTNADTTELPVVVVDSNVQIDNLNENGGLVSNLLENSYQTSP